MYNKYNIYTTFKLTKLNTLYKYLQRFSQTNICSPVTFTLVYENLIEHLTFIISLLFLIYEKKVGITVNA